MEIVKNFSKKLIENIQESSYSTEKPQSIDLILDGGVFNGSYLIGALFYIKELEERKFYHIDRISGCSIGALSALLYHINALHMTSEIYDCTIKHINENENIDILDTVLKTIEPLIPANICETMTDHIFITYYNIRLGKKVIKSKYKNIRDIFNTIKKSCFYPFLINGQPLYKSKYMDGMTPYIFPREGNKKILYLYLLGYDKLTHIFSVKNEINNFQRIISGLMDIHSFHVSKKDTLMCSYVNQCSLSFIIYNYGVKYAFEQCILYIFLLYLHLSDIFFQTTWANDNDNDNMSFKIIYKYGLKWLKKLYVFLLKNYCI